MAYAPPGIEVTQRQESTSLTLFPTALPACVIGEGWYRVDYEDFTYADTVISGGTTNYTLNTIPGVSGDIIENTITAELVQVSGNTIGSQTTVSVSHDPLVIQYLAGVVTIQNITSLGTDFTNVKPRFSYFIRRHDLDTFLTIESEDDIRNQIGDIDPFAPLNYGLALASRNSGVVTYGYGINVSGSITTAAAHTTAQDFLSTREVYGLAPMVSSEGILDTWRTHVNQASDPIEKHERILFAAPDIVWADANDNAVSFALRDAAGTARVRAASSYARADKRAFWIFPDTMRMQVTIPTARASQAYIADNLHTNATAYGLFAQLDGVYTGADGTSYYRFTNITDAIYENLRTEYATLNVFLPVPAYYYAAGTAGLRAGEHPSQSLTNMGVVGFSHIVGSLDLFTNTQLNVIANGGNWIVVQDAPLSTPYSRHHLSTDMSSIEVREHSITSALDYGSKYIRNGLTGYTGKYNITPRFLKFLGLVSGNIASVLSNPDKEDVFNKMAVTKIEQNPVSPDRVTLNYKALVKYPTNYIDITLIF